MTDQFKRETVKNCYECTSYHNTFNKNREIASSGLCMRIGDCGGGTYAVLKNQTICLFGNPDVKLSLEEIKLRDEEQAEKHKSFLNHINKARAIIEKWPKWKQNLLSAMNTIPKYIGSGTSQ